MGQHAKSDLQIGIEETHRMLDAAGVPTAAGQVLDADCNSWVGHRIKKLVQQRDVLLAACHAFVQAAKDASEHWDADRDHKAGKLLAAMAGHLSGYRAELTEVHAAIVKAEARTP